MGGALWLLCALAAAVLTLCPGVAETVRDLDDVLDDVLDHVTATGPAPSAAATDATTPAVSTVTAGSHLLPDESASMWAAEAVLGGVARLPCDLRPPTPGDEAALVIWYKGGASTPIYSLDARGRPARQQPTHWADERTLGGRAFFRAGSFSQGSGGGGEGLREDGEEAVGAHLAIENVREADAGAYRCRVDFHRSPTRNALLNLAVIVPPRNLTLYDPEGRLIEGSTLGPFKEGALVYVTCAAEGGRPTPEVLWVRDGAPLSAWADASGGGGGREAVGGGEGRAEAALRLGPLTRSDAGAELLCRAANTRLAPPLRRTLRLRMTLPALELRLVGDNRPLSAHVEQEVSCEAVGADPPPNIQWRKGGQPMSQARHTTSPDGNVTRSTLVFEPSPDDLGRELECYLADPPLRDSWQLDVRFPPELSVSLGGGLNASAIREGDDVYLECTVRAHPRAPRVEWRHGGRALASNASAGVLVTNQTLVLQAVRNASAGQYACAAANSQGAHTSRPFHLDVKYAPVCRAHQQRVYGAARMETLQVSCEVDANPPAALFRWSFNSSSVAAREVTSVSSAAGGGRSVAAYTPRAERDFGTLLCWGRNALGAQGEPCVFHVVPAGRPEAPRHCALRNRTWSALQVACARGFDGGLPQRFTLEVYAAAGGEGASKGEGAASKGRLVANVTARSAPEFTVAGLEAGAAYVLSLYASNGKGRSEEAVTLRAATLRAGAHEPRRTATTAEGERGGAVSDSSPGTPLLWALVGAGVTLVTAGVAAVVRWGRSDCCGSGGAGAAAAAAAGRAGATDAAGGDKPAGAAAAAAAEAATTITADCAVTVLSTSDDPQDNPDVVPFISADVDTPRSGFKTMDPLAVSPVVGTPAEDPTSHPRLYVALRSYCQTPSSGSLIEPALPPPLPLSVTAPTRQNAQTQTLPLPLPLPLPLALPRESAV